MTDIPEDTADGFLIKTHERGGYIYFKEDSFIVPIAIEMPGVRGLDMLVFGETEHITHKYNLKNKEIKKIEIEERFRIQNLLAKWLEQKNIKHDIQIGK
ncbi:hypothetical protein [Paenibacillus harenae]|nr:hypothetical protein [Paenibacillus harenae]